MFYSAVFEAKGAHVNISDLPSQSPPELRPPNRVKEEIDHAADDSNASGILCSTVFAANGAHVNSSNLPSQSPPQCRQPPPVNDQPHHATDDSKARSAMTPRWPRRSWLP